MKDIFEQKVLCSNCDRVMSRIEIVKNGFAVRALQCTKCGQKIIHPADMQEYNNFMSLKNKVFKVKMRIVGNSYAVSIPKEIVNFMREQDRIMDNMVRLCFNEAKKLSLMFGEADGEENKKIGKEMDKEAE
ncbi:hypothetical protein HYT26_01025 [Candidatus Pacearchaeota archaeon]|nr:hypothetical protein [Candidatus Pacearchaeota archaeon]